VITGVSWVFADENSQLTALIPGTVVVTQLDPVVHDVVQQGAQQPHCRLITLLSVRKVAEQLCLGRLA
jgi:hypothetical protein